MIKLPRLGFIILRCTTMHRDFTPFSIAGRHRTPEAFEMKISFCGILSRNFRAYLWILHHLHLLILCSFLLSSASSPSARSLYSGGRNASRSLGSEDSRDTSFFIKTGPLVPIRNSVHICMRFFVHLSVRFRSPTRISARGRVDDKGKTKTSELAGRHLIERGAQK